MRSFWLGLLAALLLPGAVCAADLKKIDRGIGKEPAYVSKQPAYCLLVFGPEAKTRVWLVADGDFLYIDRNGNGDLTESGKRARFSAESKSEGAFAGQRYADAGNLLEGKLKHERLQEIAEASTEVRTFRFCAMNLH